MDEVSLNSEPVNEDAIEGNVGIGDNGETSGVVILGENPIAPAVGMEFETYDDVYYFYNCYAKGQGFGVRVSNTWYRKSKEKYRGKLSCSKAGYKRRSEASKPRPETRTGCPAMIKYRLMENGRWRIIEVELEHNHLISADSGRSYKSHQKMGVGGKRNLQKGAEELDKAKLFRTVIVDAGDETDACAEVVDNGVWDRQCNQLSLKNGDARKIQDFLCHSQMSSPDFFYVLDFNEKGAMRNIFWAEGRCRRAFGYFDDVVTIDTTCLNRKYAVPLVVFVGTNHHGQLISLGCGLLAGETTESYIWLFRTWLTIMLGHPPRAIITAQCKILQAAISDVFPKASHFFSLVHLMESYPHRFRGLFDSDTIRLEFNKAVYSSTKPEEFEASWENLNRHFGLLENDWFKTLYEHRKRCIPVYVKDTFLAGMFVIEHTELVPSLLLSQIDGQTSINEFFANYDQVVQTIYHMETMADADSRNGSSVLKSGCYFELQLSKVYTNAIFKRFQDEVEGIYSTIISTSKINDDGPTETHIVKENVGHDVNHRELRVYEVSHNPSEGVVQCVCGLFNLKGYLCRHALSVLSQCGLSEIPPQYILSRWRKDIKRTYVVDHCSSSIDTSNPVNRHDHLYKRVVQIAQEGCQSKERYKSVLQSLDDIMNRIKISEEAMQPST